MTSIQNIFTTSNYTTPFCHKHQIESIIMDKFYNSPGLDLSGVCPGQGPMSVLRSGKDVMPFRQGTVLTTYMGDFIPPAVMPGYLGHLPGVSKCAGKTYGAATMDYFQTYRNEVLTHQVVSRQVFYFYMYVFFRFNSQH